MTAFAPRQLTSLVDTSPLYALNRCFMLIPRERFAFKRGVAVGSSRCSLRYGCTPYGPSMIAKFLRSHRAYCHWIQICGDGLSRAQRFGIARRKVRYQDVVCRA